MECSWQDADGDLLPSVLDALNEVWILGTLLYILSKCLDLEKEFISKMSLLCAYLII